MRQDVDPDVVVVGAGAGGLAAAWRLATLGLQVVVLDSGRHYEATRDYPQTAQDFELRGFPYGSVSDTAGRRRYAFGDEQPLSESVANYRTRGLGPSRPRPQKRTYLAYSHVKGVGGSTLHFQGEAHRYHPHALRMASLFGIGVDWPIDYPELERYYDVAEALIGVAAPSANDLRPRQSTPLMPAHPLSYASQRLAPAFSRTGFTLIPNSVAILSRPHNGRPRCNYCNSCSSGCPLGDKGSADVVFLPPALSTGRLRLITEATALEVELNAAGRAASVVYRETDGSRKRIGTRAVVAASGAINTPRLLMLSQSRRFPNGLANSSGQVGRHLTETLFFTAIGMHPDRLNSYRGLPIDGTAWQRAVPQASHGYVGGFRVSTAHGASGLRGPVGYARLIPGSGLSHQRQVADWFGHGVALAALGEWLPNPSTYVDLDSLLKDEDGRPLARITAWLGVNEEAILGQMADAVRNILDDAGVKDIIAERSAADQFHATHVLGTCRFGTRAEASVADPEGISWDVPNLAFADGSLVPSSGSGDSPFLTITALSIRTADLLARRLKDA